MKTEIAVLALLVLASSLLSFPLLSRGHEWGDDFASYIMQARSVLTGSEKDFVEHNAITIRQSSHRIGPVAYPWGFPILLAPAYAIFGLNPLALKLVNLLCFGFFLVAFFFYLRARLPLAPAATLTAVLGFNPSLLLAQDQILSDLSFLFFSTLSIFMIDRYLWQRNTARPLGQLAIGLAISAACFVRIQGIVLLGTVLALNVLRGWRSPRTIARAIWEDKVTYATCILFFLVEHAVLPSGEASYITQVGETFGSERLIDNALYYIVLPKELFDMLPAPTLLLVFTGLCFWVGAISRLKREAPVLIFIAASLGMLMVYPLRQGLRYLYPLLPFFVSLAYLGGQKVFPSRGRLQAMYSALWGGLVVASFITSMTLNGRLSGSRPQMDGAFDALSAEMFSYIRQNTPAASLIVFFKPRAMRLFTDRDSIFLTECERLGEGNYIVIHKEMKGSNQVPPDQVESCNSRLKLEEVFQNRRFAVYEVRS